METEAMPPREEVPDESEVIRRFIEIRPAYEQLASEIAFILDTRLREQNIPFHLVAHRAKELKSFLDKIKRKKYSDPFKKNEDFAGVRIVHLFKDDFAKIKAAIECDFKVLSRENKADPSKPKVFGYQANHLVVRFSGNLRGPRYDHLKFLKCEIQVRTVAQDAWAVMEHHLNYKDPRSLENQRVLNGLAANFELADKQFQEVRDSDGEWIYHKILLGMELSHDTLRSFLALRFSTMPVAHNDCLITIALDFLTRNSYKTVRDLSKLIESTRRDRNRLALTMPSASVEVIAALGLKDRSALVDPQFPEPLRRKIETLLEQDTKKEK
jgi:putative GTP pyrophosphokinase